MLSLLDSVVLVGISVALAKLICMSRLICMLMVRSRVVLVCLDSLFRLSEVRHGEVGMTMRLACVKFLVCQPGSGSGSSQVNISLSQYHHMQTSHCLHDLSRMSATPTRYRTRSCLRHNSPFVYRSPASCNTHDCLGLFNYIPFLFL